MADKPKLQDLPASKYPRSYTPEVESRLRVVGAMRGGVPLKYTSLMGGQAARDAQDSRDAGIQAGEEEIRKNKEAAKFVAGKGGKIDSFKKGGRVKRTGIYKLHKGEKVVPTSRLGKGRKVR